MMRRSTGAVNGGSTIQIPDQPRAHGRAEPPLDHLEPPVFHILERPPHSGITWVWTCADLDMASVPDGTAQLSRFLDQVTDLGYLLVYVGADRFVDLRGLRLLLTVTAQVRGLGGEAAVVAPPASLRRMIRVIGPRNELLLWPDAAQAVRWARRARPRRDDRTP